MIELELTEEHIALQKTVREFCDGEVTPYIKEWDEKCHFERSIFEKMMLDVMFEIPSRDDVESVTINRQSVTGERPPSIRRKRADQNAA